MRGVGSSNGVPVHCGSRIVRDVTKGYDVGMKPPSHATVIENITCLDAVQRFEKLIQKQGYFFYADVLAQRRYHNHTSVGVPFRMVSWSTGTLTSPVAWTMEAI
jgi:hypothetical protein